MNQLKFEQKQNGSNQLLFSNFINFNSNELIINRIIQIELNK